MAATCKTWSLPSDYISGLCSSRYEPADGYSKCPVCVMPVSAVGPQDCGGCVASGEWPVSYRIRGASVTGWGSHNGDYVYTYEDATWLSRKEVYVREFEWSDINAIFNGQSLSVARDMSGNPVCTWQFTKYRGVTWIDYGGVEFMLASPTSCGVFRNKRREVRSVVFREEYNAPDAIYTYPGGYGSASGVQYSTGLGGNVLTTTDLPLFDDCPRIGYAIANGTVDVMSVVLSGVIGTNLMRLTINTHPRRPTVTSHFNKTNGLYYFNFIPDGVTPDGNPIGPIYSVEYEGVPDCVTKERIVMEKVVNGLPSYVYFPQTIELIGD